MKMWVKCQGQTYDLHGADIRPSDSPEGCESGSLFSSFLVTNGIQIKYTEEKNISEINKNEEKLNEAMETKNLENAAGGDFINDVKDVIKKLNPFKNEPTIPNPPHHEMPDPIIPDPVIAHGKGEC